MAHAPLPDGITVGAHISGSTMRPAMTTGTPMMFPSAAAASTPPTAKRTAVPAPPSLPKSGRVLIAFLKDDDTTEWAQQVYVEDMDVQYVPGGPNKLTLTVVLEDATRKTPATVTAGGGRIPVSWSAISAPTGITSMTFSSDDE